MVGVPAVAAGAIHIAEIGIPIENRCRSSAAVFPGAPIPPRITQRSLAVNLGSRAFVTLRWYPVSTQSPHVRSGGGGIVKFRTPH